MRCDFALGCARRRIFVAFENRGFAFLDDMLKPAHRGGRIDLDHPADHEPVEEHPDRSEILLHGRALVAPAEPFDISGARSSTASAAARSTSPLMPPADGFRRSDKAVPRSERGRPLHVGRRVVEDHYGRPNRPKAGGSTENGVKTSHFEPLFRPRIEGFCRFSGFAPPPRISRARKRCAGPVPLLVEHDRETPTGVGCRHGVSRLGTPRLRERV